MTTRNIQMMIRISPEDKKRLEKAAKLDKVTMSEWVRIAVSLRLNECEEEHKNPNSTLKRDILDCLDDQLFVDEFLRQLSARGARVVQEPCREPPS